MMDRRWMSKLRTSAEYKHGVEQFLSFAFHDVRDGGKILCPCVNCANKRMQTYDEVKTHLRCHGILQGYTTWICHGEQFHSSEDVFDDVFHASNDASISDIHTHVPRQDDSRRLDDTRGLLNAVFNMPDYDSLDSISDDDKLVFSNEEENFAALDDEQLEVPDRMARSPAEENTAAKGQDGSRKKETFLSFLKDADSNLYDGCQIFSKLSFLVRLFHLKVLHGWSQASFKSVLDLLSDAFPEDASLPKNYHEAKKIIRGLGLSYQKIHACPRDCMLYWGERANQQSCHVCNSSRWADGDNVDTQTNSRHKKKPAKVLRYFPLIPRLQRLYATNKTSKDMRWHEEGRTKDGLLRCPADAEAWKDLDARYPDFAKDCRNIRLGITSDGFNPFRNMSSKHSTWPVMLIPYNLPPWICMKETSLILSMIIPGPSSPGNDIDVYLQPLVEELLQLWKGVDTFDCTTKKKFPLKAALLWTLSDFPALAYLYGWSTGGRYACPSCGDSTRSVYLNKGKKFSYMGHCRWLPQGHSYRRQKKKFDGTVENELAPKTMSGSSVLKMLEGRVFVYGKKDDPSKKGGTGKNEKSKAKGKSKTGKNKRKRETCKRKLIGGSTKKKEPKEWLKKKSIFFSLPYWEHNLLRHNLDVMHIEKNVCDNLIGTLLNIDSKSKDNRNARLDLVDMGIRATLHPDEDDKGKEQLPLAPFNMTKEQKEVLCSIIQKLRTPDGYASFLSRCVNMKELTIKGMKSHDCHVLIEDILPAALRSCHPSKDVMSIVCELADFFKNLCSKVLSIAELDKLQKRIVQTLCNMEKIFLPSFFTIMVHLMVHLVDEVKLGGPVHYRWMYPLERCFVRLKAFVRNRAHPEGSIAEEYIADECMTFCSRFIDGPTRFTRPERNPNPSDEIQDSYMFESAGEPIGKIDSVYQFDDHSLIQAHRYVLRHCDELADLRREFLDMEKSKEDLPRDLTSHDEEQFINKHFADWLEQKVLFDDGPNLSKKVRALARKPNKCGLRYSGFVINGCRFHTINREKGRKTQNSGVVIRSDKGINYYGRLSDIIEISYKDQYKVVLFKCEWYDVHHRAGLQTDEFGFTLVNFSRVIHTGEELEHEPFVFSSQAEQMFYVEDGKTEEWHVVRQFRPRDLFDMGVESS